MGCVGLRMLEMSSGSGFGAGCEAGGSMSPLQAMGSTFWELCCYRSWVQAHLNVQALIMSFTHDSPSSLTVYKLLF